MKKILLALFALITITANAEEEQSALPVFESMEAFVVNLSNSKGEHSILQVGFAVELSGPNPVFKTVLENYLPSIRSALILLLTSKDSDELKTVEGKARLRAQIRIIINQVVAETGIAPVKSVSFNSFIMQDDF